MSVDFATKVQERVLKPHLFTPKILLTAYYGSSGLHLLKILTEPRTRVPWVVGPPVNQAEDEQCDLVPVTFQCCDSLKF